MVFQSSKSNVTMSIRVLLNKSYTNFNEFHNESEANRSYAIAIWIKDVFSSVSLALDDVRCD